MYFFRNKQTGGNMSLEYRATVWEVAGVCGRAS